MSNNQECLNLVSQARLDVSGNEITYIFNNNNHKQPISDLRTLKYGLSSQLTYIIINIDDDFPIRLVDNDVNLINIDENFSYSIKNDNTGIDYYSGDIKITVNGDFGDISINILDKNNSNQIINISGIFFYTDTCSNPESSNNLLLLTSSRFKLLNQQGNEFDNNDNNNSNNKYNYLLDVSYNEPGFIAKDEYGHDVSYLVTKNPLLAGIDDKILTDNQTNITYNLYEYNSNYLSNHFSTDELTRTININSGPVIEISSNYFRNSNSYTNNILIENNLFVDDYNFFDNISVFVFDKSKNRINLPFEITLTGNYFNIEKSNITLSSTPTDTDIVNYTINSIIDLSNTENKNYYVSKFLEYVTTSLSITEIQDISFDNPNSNLSYINTEINFIKYNDQNDQLANSDLINKITLFNNGGSSGYDIKFSTIEQTIDSSLTTLTFNQTYVSENIDISTTLVINNEIFDISFVSTDPNYNLRITGTFKPINIFDKRDNNFIDLSFIGDYILTITTKGLDPSDNLYNDISNVYYGNIENLNDISKTYIINIIDTQDPSINFYDLYTVQNNTSLVSYNYNFPYQKTFHLYNDISFVNVNSLTTFLQTKNSTNPIIIFNDNSIYDGSLNDISTSTLTNTNITRTNNELTAGIDTSCIIYYSAYDLCNNLSNQIGLTINFIDIAELELSGNLVTYHNINNKTYADAGIFVDGSYYDPNFTFNLTTDSPYISNVETFQPNTTTYDISYSTDISLSEIGNYLITYYVTSNEGGNINIAQITRLIIIQDISAPSFYFPDLTSINIIDASNGLENDLSYNELSNNRRIFNIDNSFNIDFSLTVFSSFQDLSTIIYNFDVSDNYFQNSDLSINITISGYESDPNINFSFSDISNYLNTSTNKLNKVTKGISSLEPLFFKYHISDPCNNILTFNRKVDIIDITNPTVDFSFNSIYDDSEIQYVVDFSPDNIDFSYQAYNYKKVTNDLSFIEEINSIIFDFSLNDNYEINSNNYTITISNNLIKTIDEISNNQEILNLFSNIDTSFEIIYDFSDNQYNSTQIIRKVNIINTIPFDISFLNGSSAITISFGETSLDILHDVSINHPRLLQTDINFDISYQLPENITSISGSGIQIYDPSALIYNIGLHDISFYSPLFIDEIFVKTIEISNNGPIITISSEIYDIFEANEEITDASLLYGITSSSLYDKFYYHNNSSQNYIDPSIIIITDLNQSNPTSGSYTISYESTDQFGSKTIKDRIINVQDTNAPVISKVFADLSSNYEISGGEISPYTVLPNLTYILDDNEEYIEYGVEIENNIYSDSSINNIFSFTISYIEIDTSNNNEETDISFRDISINLTDFPNITYKIEYNAIDNFDNSINVIRNIIIKKKPRIFPYIEISGSGFAYEKIDLSNNIHITRDIVKNSKIHKLDLSYNHNSNPPIIICEAINTAIFNEYVKFNLDAVTYDGNKIIDNLNGDIYILLNNEYLFDNNEYQRDISTQIIETNDIIFFSQDTTLLSNQSKKIRFQVIDTTRPDLSLLTNQNFLSYLSRDLTIPLLSNGIDVSYNTLQELSNNIQYLDRYRNIYLNSSRFYSKNNANEIVIHDPGIKITDIVDGTIFFKNYLLIPSNSLINPDQQIVISYKDTKSSNDVSATYIIQNSSTYSQKYRVTDNNNNTNDISRNIIIDYFPPFINFNYQTDDNSNQYIKFFQEQYYKYYELEGTVKDYYYDTISFDQVNIKNILNVNDLGSQTIIYEISNNQDKIAEYTRDVDIIKIDCLPTDQKSILNIDEDTSFVIFNSDIYNQYHKYGLYNGRYKIRVDSSSNAFRLLTHEFDINKNYDVSNLINITSGNDISCLNPNDSNIYTYYYGNVEIDICGNFDRASIETINGKITEYIFVYSEKCGFISFNEDSEIDSSFISFIVDISNINNINNVNNNLSPNQYQGFTISGENFNATLRKDLYLSLGNYRFMQTGYQNFYNQIKFSLTEDGIHNGGIEYKKNVIRKNLPGISPLLNQYGVFTQLNVDATTPSILYYYCQQFPNMGGKIEIKNSIIISKDTLSINSNVVDLLNNQMILNYEKIDSKYDSNFLKNRILLNQRFFTISGDIDTTDPINQSNIVDSPNKNFVAITRQNIQHNIVFNKFTQPNRIIFRQYDSSISNTPDSIVSNITDNYLFNSNPNINFNNTFVTYLDYYYDSSSNILDLIANPAKNIYDIDFRSVYFLNNEIANYRYYFIKNQIYSQFNSDFFKTKVNELMYVNFSQLINGNSIYNFGNDEYLVSSRLIMTSKIGNYIILNLQLYFDLDKLNLSPYLIGVIKNIYKSNQDSNNTIKRNYDINSDDDNIIFFQEYVFTIYSDILNIYPTFNNELSNNDLLTFADGNICITSNIITSLQSESNNVLYKLYENYPLIEEKDRQLENLIFLGINNNDFSQNILGLTEQNIYNNIYLEAETNKFIFHSYNPNDIINYQDNSNNHLLQKTLIDSSNNNKFLLRLSDHDIYKCFDSNPLTLNTYNNLTSNYTIDIAYSIGNELSNNDPLIQQFGISPIYLNDLPIYRDNKIIYTYDRSINNISTTNYNNISNNLHTHSYLLELTDFFNVGLYNNIIKSQEINKKNISYTLTDVCYTNMFNLYDVQADRYIMHYFTKEVLQTLNKIQKQIFINNYKIRYLLNLIFVLFNNVYNYKFDLQNVKISDTFQNIVDLYDVNNLTNGNYNVSIELNRLNNLFHEMFVSGRILLENFNNIKKIIDTRIDNLIPISDLYNRQIIELNQDNTEKLKTDMNILELEIDDKINNLLFIKKESEYIDSFEFFSIDNIILDGTIIKNYSDLNKLMELFNDFYEIYNMIKDLRINMSSKHNFSHLDSLSLLSEYEDMFSYKSINNNFLYSNLKFNFNLLNENLEYDISNIWGNFYIKDVSFQNDFSINSVVDTSSLYTNVGYIRDKVNIIYDKLRSNYDIDFNADINFLENQYELSGSEILIHSIKSNQIQIKLDVKYKSFLYQVTDLSSIIIDITIPDLTPPTLIFNNSSISFSEADLNNDNIDNIIELLIDDISFIDLDQDLDMDTVYQDTSINYSFKNIDNGLLEEVNNNIYSLIYIDISSTYITEYDGNSKSVNIVYTVKDNANNINTITRQITVNKEFDKPIFYYFNNDVCGNYVEINNFITEFGRDKFDIYVEQNSNINRLQNLLDINIAVVDPEIVDSLGITFALTESNVLNFTNNFNDISFDITIPGIYSITYTSETINNKFTTLTRRIIVEQEEDEEPVEQQDKEKICCYPKVYYKPIQHNYKLGSQNSGLMRMAKFIINRHI